MDSWMGIFGILFLVCGIYIFYAYFNMKMTGTINKTILLGNDYEEKDCKDKEGYMRKVEPPTLILAIVTTVYGLIDCINSFLVSIFLLDTVFEILFLVVLVVFIVYTMRVRKQYF